MSSPSAAPSRDAPPASEGRVITFYSYKGGTGRSMAVANVACLLAQRAGGGRVLMIDWDLEAPGLPRFFAERMMNAGGSKAFEAKPGLIDLFWELKRRRDGLGPASLGDDEAAEVVAAVDPERFMLQTDVPSLWLLSSGRLDDNYSERVNTFPWEGFYNSAPGLIRALAMHLSERFRYVVVDSRTGLTDTSGICTMLLPERLVVVFTPNRQSLDGLSSIVTKATAYRANSDDLRPLIVLPLASRIEPSEPTLREEWRFGTSDGRINGFQRLFESLFREAYQLPDCDLTDYFNEVQIQHVPRYAYGEEIAVLLERSEDRLSLTKSYDALLKWLTGDAGPWRRTQAATREVSVSAAGAEKAYARLSPEHRAEMKRLLTRLVRVAPREDAGAPTAIRVSRSEMASAPPDLLKDLVDCRVISIDRDKGGAEWVRLADEHLPIHWQRLKQWLEEDADFLAWRHQLRSLMALWQQSESDSSALLSGRPLQAAERFAVERDADLTEAERMFIQLSRGTASKHRKRTRRLWATVAALLAVGLVAMLWFALHSLSDRRTERRWEELNTSGDPERVSQLADELQKSLGSSDPRMVQALRRAGNSYRQKGGSENLQRAEELFNRAIGVTEEQVRGSKDPDLPQVLFPPLLNDLAATYEAEGRLNEAQAAYERTFALFKVDDPRGADAAVALADFLARQRQYDKAIERYAFAATVYERLPELAGRLSTALGNLVQLYTGQGRLSEAKEALWRKIKADEAAFGAVHPTVADDLVDLAGLYQDAGVPEEASKLLDRAAGVADELEKTQYQKEAADIERRVRELRPSRPVPAAVPATPPPDKAAPSRMNAPSFPRRPLVPVPALLAQSRSTSLALLEKLSLSGVMEGGGPCVVKQNPLPGSYVPPRSTVTLYLGSCATRAYRK